MSEKGCVENEVVECVKKAMNMAQAFYELVGGKIENIRFEGFDTRNENNFTVDLSFQYPVSETSELDRFLKDTRTRAYKRFYFDKKTLELVSFDDP